MQPLLVALQPSPRVRVVHFGLYVSAAVAIALALLPPLVQGGLWFGILLSAGHAWRHHCRDFGVLRFSDRGVVEYQLTVEGDWLPACVSARDIWSCLIALRVTVDSSGEKTLIRRLVLIRGDLLAEDWRRLSVWLRWSKRPATKCA